MKIVLRLGLLLVTVNFPLAYSPCPCCDHRTGFDSESDAQSKVKSRIVFSS